MAANTKTPDEKDSRPRPSPAEFIRQVRTETSKVTWPTRREWLVTTTMVFIMVAVSTVFFFVVDSLIQLIVSSVLTR